MEVKYSAKLFVARRRLEKDSWSRGWDNDGVDVGHPKARGQEKSTKAQSLLWGRCYPWRYAPLTADGWGVSRARLLTLGTCAAALRGGLHDDEEKEKEGNASEEISHSYLPW